MITINVPFLLSIKTRHGCNALLSIYISHNSARLAPLCRLTDAVAAVLTFSSGLKRPLMLAIPTVLSNAIPIAIAITID